ncbi:probable glutamate receptor [Panulirus ornatus]|uniref:probable glutamate receptor n=1 Tax=Panulirus ornatus TaxID=150431 RepID=UPI003A863046
MATCRRLARTPAVMALVATVVVARAAPTTRIAVVHDEWYQSGGHRYSDVMTWTVLREAQTVLPSLVFTTHYFDPSSPHRHQLHDLLFNSTRTWAALVVLGGCRVQRAVARAEEEEQQQREEEAERRTEQPPVLYVSSEPCRDFPQHGENTVILADYPVSKRFICLTWLLRVWLTTTLYLSAHSRLRRAQPSSGTFLAEEEMYECARGDDEPSQNSLHHMLQGRTLTIVTIHRPPFTFISRGEDGSVDTDTASGMDIDILNLLQRRLGFTYRLVYSYDDNWGSKLSNGTWDGMVGMVQRQEADLGVAPFTITLAREEAIDFTFPYYYDPSAILIPAPGPIKKVTAFLDPFSSEVWLGVLVSFLVLGPTMYLLSLDSNYLYPHNQAYPPRRTTVFGYYWMLSTSLLQQGVVYPMTSASRVVFGAWITAVIALSCAYTGVLISFLTVPRVYEAFSSLSGLPRQTELKWTFRRSSALASLFLGKASEGVYREVGAPFVTDESDLVSTDHEGVLKVLEGSHAFIKEKSYLDFAMLEEYHKTGQCSLALVRETFFPAAFGWIFQEGNPLRLLFNKEFIRMQEAGLFDNWREKHWPNTKRCGIRDPVSFTKALDFQDFGGPLAILSVGYILALMSVLVERFWKNFRKKETSEKSKMTRDKKAAAKKTILAELTRRYGLPEVEQKAVSIRKGTASGKVKKGSSERREKKEHSRRDSRKCPHHP